MKTPQGRPLNKLELAVGSEPEAGEVEPNNDPAEAQRLTLPVTINGRIDGRMRGEKSASVGEQPADEDYFRFSARKGRHLTIEVAAARLGSPLDSVVEILDSQVIRSAPHLPRIPDAADSHRPGPLAERYRLGVHSRLPESDYLMVGDELNRISFIDEQPDADIDVKGYGGLRMAFLGTSPEAHTAMSRYTRRKCCPGRAASSQRASRLSRQLPQRYAVRVGRDSRPNLRCQGWDYTRI
jgi:hypothetical protein